MAFCGGILAVLLVAALLTAGCSETRSGPENAGGTDRLPAANSSVSRIEVFHFHPAHPCTSCIVLGNYAEETVSTYFADELASGKMVFAHIDGQLPENRELVEKYGVTGSSLWIGVYDANGFHKEENINVWYRLNDKQGFMRYLKGILEKRLAGDLS